MVDLTMTWPDVPTYPGHPEPTIRRVASFETHGKQVSKLEIGTHSGTHIDAPRHYVDGGKTIESIPLETLCGPAYMIDRNPTWISNKGGVDADQLALDLDDLDAVPDRLLIRFDGDERLGSMAYYREQPWLTEDAAQWLIDNGCKVIGLDTPMPDAYANINSMPVHKMLLGAGIVIVEYLVNLRSIQGRAFSHIVGPFELIVAPLKIKDGDGAPARCFAIVND